MRFEGKTALVTGAASGIGAATARRLAAEGAHVFVADVNDEKAAAVAGEIDAVAVHMDVADAGEVSAAIAGLDRPVDVLVNNAGTDLFGFFTKTTEEMWDVILAINLKGVLAVTHAVLPSMHERGGGAIVNVASEAGRVGSQGSVVYSTAKAGVIGFTRAIARESARYRVRCNAVAPGPIETPLLNAAAEVYGEIGARLKQGMIDGTMLKRSGRPEEVADTIVFLASEEASYITGQTVNVSGGLSVA